MRAHYLFTYLLLLQLQLPLQLWRKERYCTRPLLVHTPVAVAVAVAVAAAAVAVEKGAPRPVVVRYPAAAAAFVPAARAAGYQLEAAWVQGGGTAAAPAAAVVGVG